MENSSDQSDKNRSSEPHKKTPLQTTTEKSRSIAQYSGIAFQMLGTIGLGVWGGMKLDEWQQNQRPIWTIVLALTAIGASLYLFIRQITQK
ncbi:AtpZ/AtpI family protein [Spirosoma pomorum]